MTKTFGLLLAHKLLAAFIWPYHKKCWMLDFTVFCLKIKILLTAKRIQEKENIAMIYLIVFSGDGSKETILELKRFLDLVLSASILVLFFLLLAC